jgi:hypothetical protein
VLYYSAIPEDQILCQHVAKLVSRCIADPGALMPIEMTTRISEQAHTLNIIWSKWVTNCDAARLPPRFAAAYFLVNRAASRAGQPRSATSAMLVGARSPEEAYRIALRMREADTRGRAANLSLAALILSDPLADFP